MLEPLAKVPSIAAVKKKGWAPVGLSTRLARGLTLRAQAEPTTSSTLGSPVRSQTKALIGGGEGTVD